MQRSSRALCIYLRQILPIQRVLERINIPHNRKPIQRWLVGSHGLSTSSQTVPGENSLHSTKSNDHDKRTLYIRDFSHDTSVSTLENSFSVHGAVEDVSIIRTASGKSKGFGYVTFKEEESAFRALNSTHFVDKKWITAQPKIHETTLAGQSNKIRVTNVPQKITQRELENYFSKFGKTKGVDFVTIDPVSKKRKDYCFVEFENVKDASKAVETLSHTIEGAEVKVQYSTSRFKFLPDTKEVLVRSLPSNTTVEMLKECFSKFGELARVDLICKRDPSNSDTFAFLKFESSQSAQKVSESETHSFGDGKVIVKKTSLKYPMKNRHLKLLAEDLPHQTELQEIINYFSQFGTVNFIQNKELLWFGCITVVFASVHGVNNTLDCPEHVIQGQRFRVRRLCWSNSVPLFNLVNDFHFKDLRKGYK